MPMLKWEQNRKRDGERETVGPGAANKQQKNHTFYFRTVSPQSFSCYLGLKAFHRLSKGAPASKQKKCNLNISTFNTAKSKPAIKKNARVKNSLTKRNFFIVHWHRVGSTFGALPQNAIDFVCGHKYTNENIFITSLFAAFEMALNPPAKSWCWLIQNCSMALFSCETLLWIGHLSLFILCAISGVRLGYATMPIDNRAHIGQAGIAFGSAQCNSSSRRIASYTMPVEWQRSRLWHPWISVAQEQCSSSIRHRFRIVGRFTSRRQHLEDK